MNHQSYIRPTFNFPTNGLNSCVPCRLQIFLYFGLIPYQTKVARVMCPCYLRLLFCPTRVLRGHLLCVCVLTDLDETPFIHTTLSILWLLSRRIKTKVCEVFYDMSRRWEIFMLQLSLGADRDIKYAKNVFK